MPLSPTCRRASLLLLLWPILTVAALAAGFRNGFEPVPKPVPRGLYHSAGPTQPGGNAALESAASASSLVRGTLVRIAWKDLNPSPSVFNFDLLDREFERAENIDTQISLGVLDSWNEPDWLLGECAHFDFDFRGTPVSACLPWDSAYQQRKAELLQQLGQRYDDNPRLALVYMTYAAMTNGIEMHWRVDETAFSAASYTPSRLADAYNTVFDMHVDAFPTTPIAMEVHEVFNSGGLASAAYEHCHAALGTRCGVAIWWCAQRLTEPPDGESEVWTVAQQAANESFLTCQTVGNFSNQPDRFDSGAGWTPTEALQNEMSFMYDAGFRHWELWSVDITNSDFSAELGSYATLLDN